MRRPSISTRATPRLIPSGFSSRGSEAACPLVPNQGVVHLANGSRISSTITTGNRLCIFEGYAADSIRLLMTQKSPESRGISILLILFSSR